MNKPSNETEWLAARRLGMGATDAAPATGRSRWKDNVTWAKEKLGLVEPEDISGKPAVQRGKALEPLVRVVFGLDHPEYEVEYNGSFDLVRRPEEPWYLATLDGRLTERETGRRGILEIKTGSIASRIAAEQWNGRVPEEYLCQALHQLNAWLDAAFVVLVAYLKDEDSRNNQTHSTRLYKFEREEYADAAAFLLTEERTAWGYIERKELPPLILPQL